jgi:phosphoribosylaminoimidazolecarboxamide formyltransferase/IMP cyclohydrolase
MVRAAAKNHAYVTIVTDPDDYAPLLNALELNTGALSLEFRRRLAAKAFARTAAYDAAISSWFADTLHIEHPTWRAFGGIWTASCATARTRTRPPASMSPASSAPESPPRGSCRASSSPTTTSTTPMQPSSWWRSSIRRDSAAVVDHQARQSLRRRRGADLREAYAKALACDPVSAFGGIVALNRTLDAEAAEEIVKIFTEVIIAPDATPEAAGDRRGEEEPASSAGPGSLPAPRRCGIERSKLGRGRPPRPVPGCRGRRRLDLKVVTRRAPNPGDWPTCKLRLPRRQACQVERHRLCARRRDRRHRRRPDEPRGLGAHRRAQGAATPPRQRASPSR